MIHRIQYVFGRTLRASVGKHEILRPLGTCDKTVALLKAKQLDRQVDKLFSEARAKLDVVQSPYEAAQAAKALVSSLDLGPNTDRHDRDVAIDVLLDRAGFWSIGEWAHTVPRDSKFNILSSAIGILQGDPVVPIMTIKDALKLYLAENRDKGRRSDRDRKKFEWERWRRNGCEYEGCGKTSDRGGAAGIGARKRQRQATLAVGAVYSRLLDPGSPLGRQGR
jgi:hypothetical protein